MDEDVKEVKKIITIADFPKPQIEPVIGDDGTGIVYYQQGEVKFPINLASLSVTYDTVMALSPPMLERLVIANGFEFSELLGGRDLQQLTAGCVQNYWYLKTRGEIPAGVARHHLERIHNYQRLLKSARENPEAFKEEHMPGKKAKKVKKISAKDVKATRIFSGLKKNLEKIGRGQATQVYTALLEFDKGATEAQLVAAVRKSLKLKAKATPESCVHAHVNSFVKNGLASVKEPAPPKAEPKPKPEPESKPAADAKEK